MENSLSEVRVSLFAAIKALNKIQNYNTDTDVYILGMRRVGYRKI